jgi:tRNA pseudouridine38-40 synthase
MRLRYAHHLRRRPDLVSLNAMAAEILGERDFTTFSSARDVSHNRYRYVYESSFRWEEGLLVYEIAANAFLWRMVRSLVGSMLHYADELDSACASERRREAARVMARALESRDRREAGPTAPARGLFLWNVEYYSEPTRRGRCQNVETSTGGLCPDTDDEDGE